jgi:hypothetical protein
VARHDHSEPPITRPAPASRSVVERTLPNSHTWCSNGPVIARAYAAITMAILVPVVRAGQLRNNRLAVATAMI